MYILLLSFDIYHKRSKQSAFVVVLTVISSCEEFRMKKKILRQLKKVSYIFQSYIAEGDFRTTCLNIHKAYDSCLCIDFRVFAFYVNNVI